MVSEMQSWAAVARLKWGGPIGAEREVHEMFIKWRVTITADGAIMTLPPEGFVWSPEVKMMFPRAITRTHSDGLRNIFYLFVEVQDTEPHLDEWRSQPKARRMIR